MQKDGKFRCSGCREWLPVIDAVFECKLCSGVFRFHAKAEMRKHEQEWHKWAVKKGKYECHFCHGSFKTQTGLCRHEGVQHKCTDFLCACCKNLFPLEISFKCIICHLLFHTASELREHILSVNHNKVYSNLRDQSTDFSCGYCKRRFPLEKSVKCKVCHILLHSKWELQKHRCTANHEELAPIQKQRLELERKKQRLELERIQPEDGVKNRCHGCFKPIDPRHSKIWCQYCPRNFMSVFHTEAERQKHNEELHHNPCLKCGKVYVRLGFLLEHELSCHEIKPSEFGDDLSVFRYEYDVYLAQLEKAMQQDFSEFKSKAQESKKSKTQKSEKSETNESEKSNTQETEKSAQREKLTKGKKSKTQSDKSKIKGTVIEEEVFTCTSCSHTFADIRSLLSHRKVCRPVRARNR